MASRKTHFSKALRLVGANAVLTALLCMFQLPRIDAPVAKAILTDEREMEEASGLCAGGGARPKGKMMRRVLFIVATPIREASSGRRGLCA